jgi:ribosomal protein S12 methylthiotransferase accessory factor
MGRRQVAKKVAERTAARAKLMTPGKLFLAETKKYGAFLDPAGADPGEKAYRAGTHRTLSPGETLDRVRPMMKEMGITRIANVTGLDKIGLPVVMVFRPNSRSVAVSQGKGRDLDSAKASGLMESAETWHAERINLPLKLNSYKELRLHHAMVDIDELPRPDGSLFDAQRRMLWIEGVNLVDGQALWLPYEMVHTDYTHPSPPGHGCFPASTNGLASGNHLLEAACHAICEVIERDSTSVWHHLPGARREESRLDPRTVDDAACLDVLDRLESAAIDTVIWDTTSDIGVPAFHCLITERDQKTGHIGAGAGCHPAREVALLRALTEAAQTRMTYITGSRDDLSPMEFTSGGIGEKREAVRRLVGRGLPKRDYRLVPSRTTDTFEEDLAWLIERLTSVGVHQLLALDLTRPGIDLPIVRVVIPGLEAPHDDDDYLPGPRATAAMEGRPGEGRS